jgi:hypothetical protein
VTVYGLGGSGASSLVARAAPRAIRIELTSAMTASQFHEKLRAARGAQVWIDQVHEARVVRSAIARFLRASGPKIVVSAREPLNLRDETRLPVPPLSVEEAIQLYEAELKRIGQKRPEAVASIVEQLDGWPKAILQAAVESRFKRAQRAPTDATEVSHALRTILDVAWSGLSANDREVLCALATARSAVPAREVVRQSSRDERALDRLLDKSLVRAGDGLLYVPQLIASYVRASAPRSALIRGRRFRARWVLASGRKAADGHRRDPASAHRALSALRDDLMELALEADPRTSVEASLILEPLLVGSLDRDSALSLFARVTHIACNQSPKRRAAVDLAHARTLIYRGDHETAEATLHRLRRATGLPQLSIYANVYLAHIAAWRGHTDEATALLDRVDRQVMSSSLEARAVRDLKEDALVQRTFVALQDGALDQVERLARECAQTASQGPSPRLLALSRRFTAEVHLRRGDPVSAIPLFEQTRDELFRYGDYAGGLFVWSRLVEALQAAKSSRASEEARRVRDLARRGGEGLLELSVLDATQRDELSVARVTELAWQAQIPAMRLRAIDWLSSAAPSPGLVLYVDMERQRATFGDRTTDLAKRPSLWRILRALIDAHTRTKPLAFSILFAVGWPGENVDAMSKKQRVHTAIWTLRRALLGDLLETHAQGYSLHTRLEMRIDRLFS